MEKSKFLIGSHVRMNTPDYFLGSAREALSYGSAAFMFYTGAPQSSIRTPTYLLKIPEGKKLLAENNIELKNLVVHAPYIINPANKAKPDLYENSIKFIDSELNRTADFGVETLVLHPGAHVGQGPDVGIKNLIEALNKIFEINKTNVKIAIETMAGKGSEIGVNFDEVAKIINGVKDQKRIGVCFDTCHVFDSGYDLVNNLDEVLSEFDKKIGLSRVLVVHLNDSKNVCGSHKDRHENLGKGNIGFDTLYKIAHLKVFENIPKILETPYINNVPPYKEEIELLKM